MFTYKGNSQFSTTFGGIVSIVILSTVWVYLSLLIQKMLDRANSNNTLSTEVINLNTNDQNYYLYDYGFTFGVSITDHFSQAVPLDPTYFTLSIDQITTYKINGYNNLKFNH